MRGFYRGLTATLIRETPSYGAYFATYELLCNQLLPDDTQSPVHTTMALLTAGGFAGVVLSRWSEMTLVDRLLGLPRIQQMSSKPDSNPVSFPCYIH